MELMELKEFLFIIKKRLWVLVVTTVVFALLSAIVSLWFLKPVYQSSTTLYVNKKLDPKASISYQEMMASELMVKDYQELIKSRTVAEAVASKLNIETLDATKIVSKIGVSLKNQTRVILVTVRDKDPEIAALIANGVADIFQAKAVELMNVENVKIIDKALKSQKPIKPNKQLNISVASFLGIMVGLGIIFLIEYLDNTIKTASDVEKYLELPVIGTIPEFDELKN